MAKKNDTLAQTKLEGGKVKKPAKETVTEKRAKCLAIVRTDSDGPPELATTVDELYGLTSEIGDILEAGESVTFDLVEPGELSDEEMRAFKKGNMDTHNAYAEFKIPIKDEYHDEINFVDVAAPLDFNVIEREINNGNVKIWVVKEENIANFNPDSDLEDATLTEEAEEEISAFEDKYEPIFKKEKVTTLMAKGNKKNAVPIEKQVADVQLAKAAYKWFIETGGKKGLLYSNWFMPLAKNYDKKRKKGRYDEKLALKGFRELAAGILKEYKVKVLKKPEARMIFATKQALGKLLLDYYNEAFVNQAKGKKTSSKANPTRLTIEKCASVADIERFFKETCGFKFDKYGINPHTYSVNDRDDIIEIHVVDEIDTAALAKLQGYLTTMISYTVYQLIVQKDFQKFAIQRPKAYFGKVKTKPSTYQVIYDKANPSKGILKKINTLTYQTGEAWLEGNDPFYALFDSQWNDSKNDKRGNTKN